MNEEFLVGTCHQHVSITSLPFVHTARRYYRLNGLARSSEEALFGSRWTVLLKKLKLDHLEEVKVVTRFS